MKDDLEAADQIERALLACVLENPVLISQIDCELGNDLLPGVHQALWRAMVELHEDIEPWDKILLAERAKVDVSFVADLMASGVIAENFPIYLQRTRELARERRIRHLGEKLTTSNAGDYGHIIEQLQQEQSTSATDGWRTIFHSWQEFENAPKLEFAIENFLQEGGTTFVTGLPGHSKTLVMLAMVQALLDCQPLFGHFAVPRPSSRVLYLIPECTLAPFSARIKLFHLEGYVQSDRLLIRTLSSKQDIVLSDSRLLKAVDGSDVFLDTAVRFMDGAENDVESARTFAKTLFGLLSAGARTITGAHHAPKAFSNQEHMNLENVLRGSGDLGAAICTAWGLRQIDAPRNRIYVQNVKPRDFQPCEPFIIEGRPHLDQTGHFAMTEPPGFAGELQSHLGAKAGRPPITDREDKRRAAADMKAHGMSLREIGRRLGIGKSTVSDLLGAYCPEIVRTLDTAADNGTGRTL